MDDIKCDSASNAPKYPLNNGVSIVQKLVVKLSSTSTMFSQQVKITLSKHDGSHQKTGGDPRSSWKVSNSLYY
jgi:hypothetical protein